MYGVVSFIQCSRTYRNHSSTNLECLQSASLPSTGNWYWLLTVLRSGEAIPPKIELKLARLYRTAFSRQQQRHLGLLQTDPQSQRLAGERALVRSKAEISTSQEVSVNSASSAIALPAEINLKSQASTLANYNKSVYVGDPLHSTNLNVIEKEAILSNENVMFTTKSTDDSENSTDNLNQQNMQNDASFNLSSMAHKAHVPSENQPIPEKQISNVIESEGTEMHSELRLMDISAVETVHVRMQNTSVTDGGATRLIYSVHLGGKPVPAETAARDMALLSPQEVALELGAPVLIQSEPYLKESQPLALSRKRDAWLLVGAAGAGFILLAFILAGLIFTAKRKRAHSAVAAPLNRSILKKKQDYASAGPDNVAFSTSQREIKTQNTSQTQASRNISRTPDSPETPDRLEVGIHEVSNGNDKEHKKTAGQPNPWEHSSKKARMVHERLSRTNAINTPRTSDSTDVIVDHLETFDSLDTNYKRKREKAEEEDDGDDDEEEATASPHSYLSMPSCKEFPSMKGVEPLSRVLEPVIVKHLDVDSPELVRATSKGNEIGDKFFARTSSATKDPGVVGPLVWNLRRQALSTEGNDTSGTDDLTYVASSIGPVRRARKRLHELLEDSFSLFGSRDPKSDLQSCVTRPTSATGAPDVLTIFSETRGRSTYISPVSSPTTEMKSRARPSQPQRHAEQSVGENEYSAPARSRSSWGSRPLSAGPFHRPNLPDVDANRILVECQLPSEDPAVPLIASIKKELEKFSSQ
ncbi:uncharacterized protein LOC143377172 isoform X3 [Andrena cerasifolii]|uniref:uncharacterized protein LOC143377172 isoform X3 n=1 Tax=Andrena cerasifolii TaxID=2819439 RepID=UPI004037EE43